MDSKLHIPRALLRAHCLCFDFMNNGIGEIHLNPIMALGSPYVWGDRRGMTTWRQSGPAIVHSVSYLADFSQWSPLSSGGYPVLFLSGRRQFRRASCSAPY